MRIPVNKGCEEQWQHFQEKVNFLKQADSYNESCKEIEAIETHMSWVFLTDKHAYKLKKPVNFSYIDFSTLSKRFNSCHRELILNQKLARGIYQNIIPFLQDKKGHFCPVGGSIDGTVEEWLLKMKRFPRENTLDNAILNQHLNQEILYEAATHLMNFYQESRPILFEPHAYLERLKEKIAKNLHSLLNPRYELDPIFLQEVADAQLHTLAELSNYISHRIAEGRIRECHGDLRAEHICLASPPIITDRLEFSDQLRIMDPLEELSYLYIECQYLGQKEAGELFYNVYHKKLGDAPHPELLKLFKSYRACLKAKLAIWHLDDYRVHNQQKWHDKAKAYLNLSTAIFHE